MSQPSDTDKSAESNDFAALVGLFQLLLFLAGTAIGTMNAEAWSAPIFVLLGIGLCTPIALALAENSIRRDVPIDVGLDVVPGLRGVVSSLVLVAGGAAVVGDLGGCCVAFYFAPLSGLALHSFITGVVIGARELRQTQARRWWKRVEVRGCEKGVATIRVGETLAQVRVTSEIPLGFAYANIDETTDTYREPAVLRLRDFESDSARRVRRALTKLAAVRLGSALMWLAVLCSPFTGALARAFHEAW